MAAAGPQACAVTSHEVAYAADPKKRRVSERQHAAEAEQQVVSAREHREAQQLHHEYR